jgi:hypothetical protein
MIWAPSVRRSSLSRSVERQPALSRSRQLRRAIRLRTADQSTFGGIAPRVAPAQGYELPISSSRPAELNVELEVAVHARDRYGLSVVKCPRWINGINSLFKAGA